jgi:hypothetical protein
MIIDEMRAWTRTTTGVKGPRLKKGKTRTK